MKLSALIFLFFISFRLMAQYPPAAGQEGSTAIFTDSSVIVNWAKNCKVTRGYFDIAHPADSIVNNGTETDALGKADAVTISLGDRGEAVLSFSPPIANGLGPDFTVFENSFDGQFLELAFIEVSSDSIHWFRFDAVSLTQDTVQLPGFGLLSPTKINNLAGKYGAFYGTPFDLDELTGNPFLNTDSVSYVRIVDVVGSINPQYSSFDSQGNIINDPYPTPFPTGGFDLDAVGVIHERPSGVEMVTKYNVMVFPNPCITDLFVYMPSRGETVLYDISGNILQKDYGNEIIQMDVSHLNTGIYFLKIQIQNITCYKKIVVQ
jgi:hypothetical protein